MPVKELLKMGLFKIIAAVFHSEMMGINVGHHLSLSSGMCCIHEEGQCVTLYTADLCMYNILLYRQQCTIQSKSIRQNENHL